MSPFWLVIYMYAKNGGGRPGPFYHVDDINVYLGRQREEWSQRLLLWCASYPRSWQEPGYEAMSVQTLRFKIFATRKKVIHFRTKNTHLKWVCSLGDHLPSTYYVKRWTKSSPSVLPTVSHQKQDGGKAMTISVCHWQAWFMLCPWVWLVLDDSNHYSVSLVSAC